MGLFTDLILSLVSLILLAIDIIFFFVLVRMLSLRWCTPWLVAFNSTGKPLVDWFISQLQTRIGRITSKSYSDKALLVAGMVILIFVRFFLGTVALLSK